MCRWTVSKCVGELSPIVSVNCLQNTCRWTVLSVNCLGTHRIEPDRIENRTDHSDKTGWYVWPDFWQAMNSPPNKITHTHTQVETIHNFDLYLISCLFLMTDFICHFFAASNLFSVSDFHYHWTCFRTKRSATYIQVLRHLQIDLVKFIWCLKAMSLEFWIYFKINTEKKNGIKKCLV